MSLFIALLVLGLIGMLLMAIPGLNHGHAGIGSHVPPHVPRLPAAPHAAAHHTLPAGQSSSLTRFIPSPRVIFGFLALYGAFGNAFEKAGHLPVSLAALAAIVPAFLLERYALSPFWNRLMAFQGTPCAPLETLVMCEAKAVTPFRNGRGMVSVVYENRLVQMRADLLPAQIAMPVRVGDTLRVEEIDGKNERVVVSLA